MRFGIVADDNTGATDAAGMLTERGVRTVLFVDVPPAERLHEIAAGYDAVVIGAGTRSVAPEEARARTAEATRGLARAGAEKVQLKYSSTFDSTPRGNIGPSLDAAMDVLGARATIVCPALPVHGRTTCAGFHFVDGSLLSDSPMSVHPLNPMTDANLVRWLGQQTPRRVASAPLTLVRGGPAVLRDFLRQRSDCGDVYFVTDAVRQSDLRAIAQATEDWPFISGASGITAEVPGIMFPGAAELDFGGRLESGARRTLVVAGSCTPATRAQNAAALEAGFAGVSVPGADVVEGRFDPANATQLAVSALGRSGKVVLYASADPDEVGRVQTIGRTRGLSEVAIGEQIAGALAGIAAKVVASEQVGRLLVSGGETSTSVCRRLGITAMEVGLPIEPGVPYCFPLAGDVPVVVLKSGNFGAPDFYTTVAELGLPRPAAH